MKLLLVNPESYTWLPEEYFLPLSLLALGSVAQRNGVEVSILDLNVTKYKHNRDCTTELLERVVDFQPDLIGFGCMFAGQLDSVIRYSERVKNKFPHIHTVTGGMQPTLFYKDILNNCPSLDYIVVGEGEIAICALCDHLDSKLQIEEVPSLAWRNRDTVVLNPRKVVLDINTLPMNDYGLVNIEDYYHEETKYWHNPRNLPINATLPLLASRGCPIDCTFCCLYEVMGKKMRYKNPNLVVDEIEYLYHAYGHRHFSWFDDQLVIKKAHILEVCNQIVKRNLNIQFETPNGVAVKWIDEEVLSALVGAGMVNMSMAIEHGSEYMRNTIIKKGLAQDKIYEVAALTKKFPDLLVRAFFIIGFPEETPETLQETYKMIQEIDVDKPIVNNLMPYAGTSVFEQCVRDNLFVDQIDLNNIWRFGDLSFSSTRQFYVKPYNMTLDELEEYRSMFDEFVSTQIKKRGRWNERRRLVTT